MEEHAETMETLSLQIPSFVYAEYYTNLGMLSSRKYSTVWCQCMVIKEG
jgi:hypothetical protein